jgi:CheY-like chemotaxis protein
VALLLDPRRLRSLCGPAPEPVRERERRPDGAAPRRLLLVEDSPTVRRLLARTLAAAGFVVEEAANGLEAWARLGLDPAGPGARPDVLVTDLEMPHLDGFELVKRVRATVALASLPIVVVTSKDTRERRRSLASLGVRAVVAKQSGDAALVTAVCEAARARPSTGGGNSPGPGRDN